MCNKKQDCVIAWVEDTDLPVVGAGGEGSTVTTPTHHRLKPVKCSDYVAALEEAISAAHLTLVDKVMPVYLYGEGWLSARELDAFANTLDIEAIKKSVGLSD